MQLIELSANKPSFKTVEFNPYGLTIFVAKKFEGSKSSGKKTYNSVGKSLIIALIHFCLGSKAIDDFKTKLPDWEFSLKFSLNGEIFKATRSTANQKCIILNDKPYNVDKFNLQMESLIFPNVQEIPYMTWRTLLPRFIRKGKDSYSSYDKFYSKETPYRQLLNNGYLLGLQTELIVKKHSTKKSLDETKKLKNTLEKDPIFRTYFIDEDKDIDIEIANLEDVLKSLDKEIKNFKIAENYDDLKRQADELSDARRSLANEINICKKSLESIGKSLRLSADISIQALKAVYDEVNVNLSKNVIRSLVELTEFHNNISTQRVKRLKKERKEYISTLEKLEKQRNSISEKFDEYLKYFDEHGAIEELIALNKKQNNLKNSIKQLESFKEILRNYTRKIEKLKKDLIGISTDADNYLVAHEFHIKTLASTFRKVVKSFYINKSSILKISSNTNENQIVFDINAKIQDDSGDGINEVKIFTYDLTMFLAGLKCPIDFIFHDSRILSNMDARQQKVLFNVAKYYSEKKQFQYIISINQNVIDSIKNEMENDDFLSVFNKENIKLTLTDKSDDDKLLGIQVDLKYE